MANMTQADVNAYNSRQLISKGGKPFSQPVTREANLHQDILDECKRRGWIALHGRMAEATGRTLGEFDFTILADNGRVFLVECKTKTGKLSSEQLGIHAWSIKLGHQPFTVRSFEEFLDVVK